jgi:hypothetical protein
MKFMPHGVIAIMRRSFSCRPVNRFACFAALREPRGGGHEPGESHGRPETDANEGTAPHGQKVKHASMADRAAPRACAP